VSPLAALGSSIQQEEDEDGCISAFAFTRCLSSLAAGGGATFGLPSPWFRQSLLLFSLNLRIISGRTVLTDPNLRKSRYDDSDGLSQDDYHRPPIVKCCTEVIFLPERGAADCRVIQTYAAEYVVQHE